MPALTIPGNIIFAGLYPCMGSGIPRSQAGFLQKENLPPYNGLI
jgi:hypothetical protein